MTIAPAMPADQARRTSPAGASLAGTSPAGTSPAGTSPDGTSLAVARSDVVLSDLELDVLEPDEIAAGVRLVLDDDGTLSIEDGFVAVETGAGTVYRWRCAVCGYIHEAPSPPRWCPLCGADSTQFEALVDGQP